jgi:predicted nucleic acid-binding protein
MPQEQLDEAAFFAGPMEWAHFDEEDAREAGAVRAELESTGRPIGAYDVLLAGRLAGEVQLWSHRTRMSSAEYAA